MGQAKMRRLMVALLAMIMTLAMVVPSFAATNSSTDGEDTAAEATVKITSTAVNVSNGTLKVSYSGKNAEAYMISYRVAGGTWKYKMTSNKSSYTITGLSKNKLYQVRMTGINADGKAGKTSNSVYRYIANTSYKTLKAESKGFYIQVAKISGADKYEVRYSENANLSGYKSVRINSGIHIKNLKANKKYYIQIRPVKSYNGTTYLGSSQKTYTITTKK